MSIEYIIGNFVQYLAIFCLFGEQIHGFTIDESLIGPGFSSMMDLQNHYLKSISSKGNKDLSKWNKWANTDSVRGPFSRFNEEALEHDMRRLQLQDFSENQAPFEHLNLLTGRHARRYGPKRDKSSPRRGLDELVISKENKPSPPVQFWSKRDTKAQTIPHTSNSVITVVDPKVNRSEKYAMMDKTLETLQPDTKCLAKIGLCAKMPIKNLECILHCQLSTHALAKPSTKFLYRLLKVYASFPKMLCPTFGRIYSEIPSLLKHRQQDNSLSGFLASVGIVDEAPVNVDFIKISPSSLFNNLVKFGKGEDFELVKAIVDTAETAATVQLSDLHLFPSIYGNPLCKLVPKEGWFVSMIDAMTKHPTLTDIFLRGYWILTRALNLDLQYPLDALFVSLVYSIKLLTGVDCSIIAYAEHGKPFKCKQTAPVDTILDSYTESAKDDDADNSYSWVVCGAHQVEIPDWIQTKEGLHGRSGAKDEDSNADIVNGPNYNDLDEFPNPEEEYPSDWS